MSTGTDSVHGGRVPGVARPGLRRPTAFVLGLTAGLCVTAGLMLAAVPDVDSSTRTSGVGVLVLVNVQLDARGYRFVQHKNKFGQEYTKSGRDRY